MSGMLLSSSSSIQRMQHVNTADPDQLSVASHGTLSLLSAALLVGISYYFGTRMGFAWTPRGWPNSTFWPPNAILLAALLVAPRRAWWMFFLAVLPAHMFAQLQTGVPVWTAAFWFITNSFEAFLGAYYITKFSGPERRLDSVRWVFVFVVFGVLVAPLATSFLDAAGVVITGWGKDYWHLGLQVFFTNALAVLTIVPPVIALSTKNKLRIRRISAARLLESALLMLASVLVAFWVFGPLPPSTRTMPTSIYISPTSFGVGCCPIWPGGIKPVSLLRQPDLNVVRNARTRTVPAGFTATEHTVTANFVLPVRSGTHVSVCCHDRGATHARVPTQHEQQLG